MASRQEITSGIVSYRGVAQDGAVRVKGRFARRLKDQDAELRLER